MGGASLRCGLKTCVGVVSRLRGMVVCSRGFGCGDTPKTAGEGVELGAARGCVNTFVPGLTATNPEESERL